MSKIAKILSAICCWLLGTLLGFALSVILMGVSLLGEPNAIPPFVFFPVFLLYALPVWLFIFLPTFFLISGEKIFWHPLVAPAIGGLVALLIFFLPLGGVSSLFQGSGRKMTWMPIFIGIFTFALGSLFKRSFWRKLYVILKSENSANSLKGDY